MYSTYETQYSITDATVQETAVSVSSLNCVQPLLWKIED